MPLEQPVPEWLPYMTRRFGANWWQRLKRVDSDAAENFSDFLALSGVLFAGATMGGLAYTGGYFKFFGISIGHDYSTAALLFIERVLLPSRQTLIPWVAGLVALGLLYFGIRHYLRNWLGYSVLLAITATALFLPVYVGRNRGLEDAKVAWSPSSELSIISDVQASQNIPNVIVDGMTQEKYRLVHEDDTYIYIAKPSAGIPPVVRIQRSEISYLEVKPYVSK